MSGYLQPQLQSVGDLFKRGIFTIPDYQRSYSWDKEQWRDLWEDLGEGLLNPDSPHFIGTIVLRDTCEDRTDTSDRPLGVFHVVDGQQRLTTLVLLGLAAFGELREERAGPGVWQDFIEADGLLKLEPGGTNKGFFGAIVEAVRAGDDLPAEPERATNRRLRGGVRYFRDCLRAGAGDRQDYVRAVLKYVRQQLQVLVFVTDSPSLAIKTFQSVNDRGLRLSVLDRTKSVLMFYVSRYLDDDRELASTVETRLGTALEHFDRARDFGRRVGIDYIRGPKFAEEELLSFAYHYFAAYAHATFRTGVEYSFDLAAESILDGFLKPSLRALRSDRAQLRRFIDEFTADFAALSMGLSQMLERADVDPTWGRFLRIYGPTAPVYPLLVALETRLGVDDTLMKAVETMDLRVYKVRGTGPRAWLFRWAVSRVRLGATRAQVMETIAGFTAHFGSDAMMDSYLSQAAYKQAYTKIILWEAACGADSETAKRSDATSFYRGLQVDHVLPREASSDATTCGFDSEEEYGQRVDLIGNLYLLEDTLNQGAGNVSRTKKSEFYSKSDLEVTRILGVKLADGPYCKADVTARVKAMIEFAKRRWPLRGESTAKPVEDADLE